MLSGPVTNRGTVKLRSWSGELSQDQCLDMLGV